MRRSLFSILRGTDGRSIGRALAFLLLVNALAAGFHTGAIAGTGALCTVSHSGGSNTPPAPAHPDPCCMAGCATQAAALPGESPSIETPEFFTAPSQGFAASSEPTAFRLFDHGPRGPPFLI
jgi:hypothetical protein